MSTKCAQCGAGLAPGALVCPYCQVPTPGAAAHEAEERRRAEWHQAHAAQAAAYSAQASHLERGAKIARMESAATTSLAMGIVSVVICCPPVFQAISVAMYFRARALARELATSVPARATAGLATSILSIAMFTAFMAWAMIRDSQLRSEADARATLLERQTSGMVTAPALDHATACGLAEMYVLRNGYKAEQGHRHEAFQCAGRLEQAEGTASLDDFQFQVESNHTQRKVTVCFRRGERWYVQDLREGSCAGERTPTPTAAPPTTRSTRRN